MNALRVFLMTIFVTFNVLVNVSTLAANLTQVLSDRPTAVLALPLPQCPR